MNKDEQYDALRGEVVRLFEYVQKIKAEVASIKHPNSKTDAFNTVADQLDDIVSTTSDATQQIMDSVETMDNVIGGLRVLTKDKDPGDAFDVLGDCQAKIFEACSFQDLTGQRISKIIRTMNLIEGTLNSLVVIIGEDSIAALPVVETDIDDHKDDDGVPLHGPQRAGEGISQDDIDKLFD